MVTLRPLDPVFPVRVEGRGTNLCNMNDALKKIQKETGLKMGDFPNEKNRIYNMCQLSILMLENIWKDIQANELQNSQMCLDWLDKINEISIRN